jgi:tetratricopeptide (TPR) repeat protein
VPMRHRIKIFTLLSVLALPFIFSCAKVAQNQSLTNFIQILLKKNTWTIEDRQTVVHNVTVNALNKLLIYFGADSIDAFYKGVIMTGTLSNTKYDAPIEVVKLSKQVSDVCNVYYHLWLINQQTPVMVYYIMEGNVIKDLQLFDAKLVRSRWSIGKFIGAVIGGIFIWYWLAQFFFWVGSSITGEEGCGSALVIILTIILIIVAIIQGVDKTYQSIDGRQFDPNLVFEEEPYPGPSQIRCEEAVIARMNDILTSIKEEARGNESLANTFAQRGRQYILKSDAGSLIQALDFMKRSVQYKFDNNMVIDVAKILNELALQDVQPESNRMTALSILRSPVLQHQNFLRKECVLSLVMLFNGQINSAKKKFENTKGIFNSTSQIDLETKLSFYETYFYIEKDNNKRIEIANELILLEPDNVKYYYLKAVANFAAGNDDVGRRSIERARAMNRNYSFSTTEQKLLDYTLPDRYKSNVVAPQLPERMTFEAVVPFEDVLAFVGGSFEPFETELVISETLLAADSSSQNQENGKITVELGDESKPFAKKGLVGVWKLRKNSGKKAGAVFLYIVLLFLVAGIIYGIAEEAVWEAGAVFFTEFISITLLYFFWWGVRGIGSWIWMGVTAIAVAGFVAAITD